MRHVNHRPLKYETLEKIHVMKPVDRLDFFVSCSQGRKVLDIGSYDETAFSVKIHSRKWLFGRIEESAERLVGIDSSLPCNKMLYKSAEILKLDAMNIDQLELETFDLLSAGELIEHLSSPLAFLECLKSQLSGKEFIISTPNGGSAANFFMALIGKEAQHKDHLHVFTYKTLNTLLRRANFINWEIIPAHFAATEMKLKSKSKFFKKSISLVEKMIRLFERLFPLTASTLIAKGTI